MLEDKILQLEKKVLRLEKEIAIANFWKSAPNRQCYTAKEVAQMLGCSIDTVKKREQQGLLIPLYPNTKKRYHYKDVEHFMRGYSPSKKRVSEMRAQKKRGPHGYTN